MKTLYLLVISLLLSIPGWGQARSTAGKPATGKDVVYKTSGEQMTGKVIKITDTDVSFVYTGEEAEYVINKADIQKIVHASGRVETFTGAASPPSTRHNEPVSMTASPVDHHNKIAVLPFVFLIDRQSGAPEMGYKAQDDTYSFLVKHSAGYTVQDTRTTNALLLKAGVTRDKMMGFTMKEICDILGVEYVIDGTITQNKGYATTSTGGSTNTAIKRDGDKVKALKTTDVGYTNSVQRYEVAVALNIFMDNNASIYNQQHKAFLTSTDASYGSPLDYLLKRCPLYRK